MAPCEQRALAMATPVPPLSLKAEHSWGWVLFCFPVLTPTGLAALAVLRGAGFLPSAKTEGLGKPGDSWDYPISNSGRDLRLKHHLIKTPPPSPLCLLCLLLSGSLGVGVRRT